MFIEYNIFNFFSLEFFFISSSPSTPIGILGCISSLNVIFFLISNEIIILGLVIGFISLNNFYCDKIGHLLCLCPLVISAVETAIVSASYLKKNLY